MTTRLAVCQVAIDIDDPAGTRQRVEDAAAEAAGQGAQVIVLPELCLSGYVFRDLEETWSRAEAVDGPSVQFFRELAVQHGAIVVGGFCERSDGERPFNSAVVVEGGEVLAVYRKTHLWGTENLVFAVGDALPPVVQTSVGAVAVMICYDLEFPEMVRDVALRGAQLVLAPSNWPTNSPPPGERAPEVVKALANAAVNRVFVVVADRVGTERGVEWIGGSVVADVEGYPVAGPGQGDPVVLIADLDLDRALDKTVGDHNHAFHDRRPELYRQGVA